MSNSQHERLNTSNSRNLPSLKEILVKNPFISIGVITTTACLTGLMFGTMAGGPQGTAIWAKRRVLAQGFALGAVAASMGYVSYVKRHQNREDISNVH